MLPAVLEVLVLGVGRETKCQCAELGGAEEGEDDRSEGISFGGKERERGRAKALNLGNKIEYLSEYKNKSHHLELYHLLGAYCMLGTLHVLYSFTTQN